MKGGQTRLEQKDQSRKQKKSEKVRSELVCFQDTDIIQGSSRWEQEFFVRHSGREDSHGPVRNGVSRGQSVIVSCQN
jgi:hypothetical protein